MEHHTVAREGGQGASHSSKGRWARSITQWQGKVSMEDHTVAREGGHVASHSSKGRWARSITQ